MGYTGIKAEKLTKAEKFAIVHDAIYGGDAKYTCVAETMKGNNYWGVLQFDEPTKHGRTRVIVHAITKCVDGEFCYNVMTEFCGPGEENCPLSYFELAGEVPATEIGFARHWRNRVRAYWNSRK